MENDMFFLKNIGLVGRIVIGLIIGVLAGLFIPRADFLGLFGAFFIGALKAVAPALVFVLVMSALINASGSHAERFRKIVFLYLFSTLTAAIVAVLVSFAFPVKMNFLQAAASSAPGGLKEVALALLSNLVDNPVSALLKANYIGILIWAIVFGIALKKQATEPTKNMISQFAEALTTIVRWIISLAPIGIMGIVFTTVSQNGMSVFETYGKLVGVLVFTMLFIAMVVNPMIVFFLMRRNPYPLVFKCLKGSGLTAFFTRSSAANIPVNMELCEELQLDKEVYSVSVPLGATVNMDGAAVTITVMTMAAVHTLGIDVTIPAAIMMSILAALAACGASGVAGGAVLLIPLACSLFGISNDIAMQVVAVGFTVGVIQDSLETALNSSGDVLFVAASEFSDKIKRGEPLPKL
ncbi:MAG: serine/threonine transporter SstT [Alphaproteobacteria bacterium]|nr:serine/threonine transporter SstT [Alphaproteobacteria bacterium]MBO4644398.1 serine/threonine transporter SstT [Alphaproteobacteria bacterium]